MASIEFSVNGRKCSVNESIPRDTTLNAYLRYCLALPGTKAMCHEGGCGACVVAVRARRANSTETFSVNSCLVLVFSCHGWDITTVEGAGSRLTGYSDVQKRIVAFNGSQCGYCTPGWVMHMTSLQDKHLTMSELERSFGSNTCRCTGFRPILDAMKSFAVDASADLCQKVSDIEDLKICSKTNAICERRCSNLSVESDWSVISDQHFEKKDDRMISFSFGKQKFFRIYYVDDAFDILDKYGVDSYMFVDGNTGKGTVETFEYPRILIDISGIQSLKKFSFDQNLILGANMALEDCITLFKETSNSKSEFTYLAEFVKHFELIAHIPVRKIGSLAGNLMLKHANPSYQSDVFLLLETVGAMLVIQQRNGKKTLSLLDFLQYDMRGMLIVAIEIPPMGSTHVFRSYKIMPRNQNALAIVNAAFLFKVNTKTKVIEDADICYGNISSTFVHAKNTEAFLRGKMVFNNVVLQAAIKILNKEIVPKSDPAQPSTDFRRKLAVGTVETFEYPRILIDISGIQSLKKFSFDQNLILGANMALEDCITLFKETSNSKSEFTYLAEFVKHFELIAHIPVRKIGSLAGNLMLKHANPSYQSDVFLLLETVGAMLVIQQRNGKKTLSLLDFLQYDMRGMLIVAIEIPPMGSTHVFRSYKIMPRNQNALAIVNAAFLFKVNTKTKVIEDADICYGNISSTFVHAKNTEAFLRGKMVFNNVVLQAAIKILNKEIVPKSDPAQPSTDFRRKLAVGLFYKVILNICPANALSPRYRSGAALIQRPLSRGSQEFQTDSSLFPLNQPVPKLEAPIQAAGEAKYANDIPPLPREVFGAFVQATVHSGELAGVDGSDVLGLEGVIAVYTAKDIPGVNSFTVPGFQLQTEEEEIIVSKTILYHGQPVAIVIANSEDLAVKVAKKVKVTYKNVASTAPVLTIDQAKKDSKRYVASDVAITPKGKGTDVKKVIKGVYEIEGQYHYYMEPVTCVVVPVDQGLEVYDSTQWMDMSQRAISRCLKMNESDVHLKVRRIGGGFGGKISRNIRTSAACALAARLLNTPCRFIVPLQTNMATAGGRLPCQCEYEVGVDDNGKIQYLTATIVEDNGCSNNENILAYVTPGFTNCYNPDYFDVKTATVTTNTPANTFARAPGTSEGMACIEHIMEHIAFAVQKDPSDVRIANMRTDDNDLPSLIETWKKETDYEKRLQSIKEFNTANRWMKKAIKINIMSFPVEYYGNYSAMVSIYRGDGTVTVTTGGVEMGQGVNTKVAQVVAYKLRIPLEMVTVLPNYSFVAANNVFSGSSIVSESVCYSAIRACDILNERLQPIREKMSNPTWSELATQAGADEIDLTATYMMTDKESDLSSYTAFAVVILETQLDVLLGRYEILRCDILEDVGLSTNPTIDVSQVEGAYVQGLGYFTTEKLIRDPKTGKLLSNRSLTYHVPLALDIPADFRVKLRFNSKNKTGVLGSKAVGEMGICTAHGITHVLRECIHESRIDSRYDKTNWINIDIPYDAESIVTALDVKLEEFLIA